MAQRLHPRNLTGLTFAAIVATILLPTTQQAQHNKQLEACTACIGKLIFDLEYTKNILNKTYNAGAITIKDVQNSSLLDQLISNQPNLVKPGDCKKNCVHLSIYKQTCDSFKELIKRDDLLKVYNTVYWCNQSKEHLAGLTTALNKLTYIDRAKDITAIAQDFKQCEKVILTPELKSELKRNTALVKSTIKRLQDVKF